jgi:hypothetical protein
MIDRDGGQLVQLRQLVPSATSASLSTALAAEANEGSSRPLKFFGRLCRSIQRYRC